jgi:hypothetical protein
MDEGTPYRPNFVPRAGTKQGRRVLNPYFRKALSSGPSSDGGLDRIHSVARDQGFSYHDARSPLDVFEGLREVVDADRAMTITITGSADDLTVHIGIGKWLQHLGVAAIETLLVGDLFLVVDVADSAWNLEIEDKLVKDLKTFMG